VQNEIRLYRRPWYDRLRYMYRGYRRNGLGRWLSLKIAVQCTWPSLFFPD
jgi:hypothetical protein